ncbi:MAG: DUF1353 domain-containing protein [Pirellulales bacterium]
MARKRLTVHRTLSYNDLIGAPEGQVQRMTRRGFFSVLAGLTVVGWFALRGFWLRPDPGVSGQQWGKFPTSAKVEFLDDGRLLKLLEDFSYVDPRGKVWQAPKGLVIDGASIPRAFWTIVGGPLKGQYRNASIVHDQECDQKTHAWQDVHYMFYEACRCGGVSDRQGKILYYAVYHFGPRWELRKVYESKTTEDPDGKVRELSVERTVAESLPTPAPPSQAQLDRLQRRIEADNPSLETLRSLDPGSL